jgi:hypothetical protein
MRVLLKFELDCTPDAALSALLDPSVFRAVSAPFTTFESLEPGGFPHVWTPGAHRLLGKAFSVVPIGEQIVDLTVIERPGSVRIVRDSGSGVSGALAVLTGWQHSMAVSPLPGGRTFYRDQLVFGAGLLSVPAWFGLWAFWQWRGARIRSLSKGWRA